MTLDLFGLFYKLLSLLVKWSTNLYNFLFNEVTVGFTIPLINYDVGFSFVPFWAIGLPLAVSLFVMSLAKMFLPLV